MEIVKFGETFNIKEEKSNYTVSGDLIKTVNGDVIINVGSVDKEGNHLSSLSGDYKTTDGEVAINFKTPINSYHEQAEIVNSTINAIETILK